MPLPEKLAEEIQGFKVMVMTIFISSLIIILCYVPSEIEPEQRGGNIEFREFSSLTLLPSLGVDETMGRKTLPHSENSPGWPTH